MEESLRKSAVTFTDFVNCDSSVITALLSTEDVCNAASVEEDMEESDEDEQHVPPFGEAVTGSAFISS